MESQADEKLQVGAGQPVGRRGCGPLSPGLRRRGRARPEAARQLCLADALLPHPLIQHHFDGGERRQHSHLPSL